MTPAKTHLGERWASALRYIAILFVQADRSATYRQADACRSPRHPSRGGLSMSHLNSFASWRLCRNAAQCESLGHRPRFRRMRIQKALKGRELGDALVSPRWGCCNPCHTDPGRCPGLSHCVPLARNAFRPDYDSPRAWSGSSFTFDDAQNRTRWADAQPLAGGMLHC